MGVKKGEHRCCFRCGRNFYVYPYLLKGGTKYCSLKCKTDYPPKTCVVCENMFIKKPDYSIKYWNKKECCSQSCAQKNRKDNVLNLGIHAKKGAPVPKTAFKKSKTTFKGTLAEYKKLHYQIGLLLGKPTRCEHCNGNYKGRKIDWANKSGEYREEKDDWIRLCKRCHWHHDKQFKRMDYKRHGYHHL